MKSLGRIMLTLVGIALSITFVLALFFRGSLMTTWLCINSVQLLSHVPLISSSLPANAHYFFLNLLSIMRLNFDSFNSSVDDIAAKLEEYELIKNDGAYYSAQMHNFGYRFSFSHNMLVFACAAGAMALVWLFVAVFGLTGANTKKSVSYCLTKFALAAHFELMISSFITLSNVEKAGSIWWFVSLASVTASVIAITILAHRAMKTEN